MSLTPKQELFAQKYIELGNASEAYRIAYNAKNMKPASINRMAKDLMDNLKITSRVNELRALSVQRHLVTVDSLTAELDELKVLARDNNQFSPAVSAVMGKAKLHGHIVDKLAGAKGEEPIGLALMVSKEEAKHIKNALNEQC